MLSENKLKANLLWQGTRWMFQISAVKNENCRSDFDFNTVQNEARYNKSGNNMLTAKAKNHGCKKKKKKKTKQNNLIIF